MASSTAARRSRPAILAGFAHVLARVAHADLEVDDSEIAEMERIVREFAHLSEAEATLVVQIAKSQARHLGGTENYVVTREFRRGRSKEQRAEFLEWVYAVAAAEVAVGLALVIAIWRTRDTVVLEDVDLLKG